MTFSLHQWCLRLACLQRQRCCCFVCEQFTNLFDQAIKLWRCRMPVAQGCELMRHYWMLCYMDAREGHYHVARWLLDTIHRWFALPSLGACIKHIYSP